MNKPITEFIGILWLVLGGGYSPVLIIGTRLVYKAILPINIEN